MNIGQIEQFAWWALLGGYVYAVFYGHFLISPIVGVAQEIVEPGRPRDPQWQPFMTGVIERTLYVTSLLVGRAEFIVIWVTLKMALQYKRWTGETKSNEPQEVKDKEALVGRQRFMNSLNGNGLSILHALVGFLVLNWLNDKRWDRVAWATRISLAVCTLSVIALDFYKERKADQRNNCTEFSI